MTVEYAHYLFSEDPYWVAPRGTAARLYACLRKWNLILEEEFECWDAVTGVELSRDLRAVEDGTNLFVRFSTPDSPADVARVMGPSAYANEQEGIENERYLAEIIVWLGTSHGIPVEQFFDIDDAEESLEPPEESLEPPDAQERTDLYEPSSPHAFHVEVDDASDDAPVMFDDKDTDGHPWKTVVRIDCSADFPAFAREAGCLPNREFFEELQAAVGTPLVEKGVVY